MKIKVDIRLIIGEIRFENIETGFWVLVDSETNKKYRIKKVPEALKVENIHIAAVIQFLDNEVSYYMTGQPIKILEFKPLSNGKFH